MMISMEILLEQIQRGAQVLIGYIDYSWWWFWLLCNAFFVLFGFCNVNVGTKRGFGDLDDDEDDIFGSKKVFILLFVYCL